MYRYSSKEGLFVLGKSSQLPEQKEGLFIQVVKRKREKEMKNENYKINKPSFCSGSCDEGHAHETFFNNLESFLETSLKHSGNTLNHETPLKHP